MAHSSGFTVYESSAIPPVVSKEMEETQNQYLSLMDQLDNIQLPTPPMSNLDDYEFPENFFEEYIQNSDLSLFKESKNQKKEDQTKKSFYNYPTSKKTTVTKPFGSKENYVRTMYPYIYKALQDNGLDADKWAPLLVAQTALESGWGNDFSRRNNNYAGIKGKGSGATATKEFIPGKGYVTIKDSFKSYPSIAAFADDFVKKLKNRFNAFKGGPSEYLSNIKSKGYFTAPLSDYSKIFNVCLKTVNNSLS